MTEGVAKDQGAPGSPAVGQDGKPLNPRIEIRFETDKEGARKVARAVAKMGQQDVADRIAATIGDPAVKVGFMEKHPGFVGASVGALIMTAGFGVYKTVAYFRAKKLRAQLADKVIPLPPARAPRTM